MFDEHAPKRKPTYEIGQALDDLSVEEIVETIGELKAEIDRLETARAAKSDHLSAAEALFARKT